MWNISTANAVSSTTMNWLNHHGSLADETPWKITIICTFLTGCKSFVGKTCKVYPHMSG